MSKYFRRIACMQCVRCGLLLQIVYVSVLGADRDAVWSALVWAQRNKRKNCIRWVKIGRIHSPL